MLKVNQNAEPVISITMGYQEKTKNEITDTGCIVLHSNASPSSIQNPI